jgi:4-methoxybenzoate monooxygenase (O-demethylating)
MTTATATATATSGLLAPPALDIDPYSDENLIDPYPFFELLRDTAPVVYLQPLNVYAVGRYAEVTTVATDHKRFTVEGGIGFSDVRKPGFLRDRSPISEVDPPEHTGVRAALQKILSPLVIRRWREDFEKEAQVVVDEILDRRDVDGVRDIAERFVLSVFPRAVGIDAPPHLLLMTGELNFNQMGPNNARLQRALERAKPYVEWYADQLKREKMLPGGFGEQIYQAADRGEFAAETAPAHVRSFFRAGVDTSAAGIGLTLNQLARHPDQFDMLRKDPTKVKGAFDEGLRFESPAQSLYRTTVGDVELSGYALEADTKIAYYPGAANRDPRFWTSPDTFDITRAGANAHRAFGVGTHVCIGQMIARLESDCLLGALAKRTRSVEPAGEPKYRLVNALRTLDTLPLHVVPA